MHLNRISTQNLVARLKMIKGVIERGKVKQGIRVKMDVIY